MCPSCGYTPAPGEVVEGSGCPQCGQLLPERDQPGGTTTDFQTFGLPDPGEDDGNQGNPLAVGTIVGKDGERSFKNRDNYMGKVYPPLWMSASEIEPDLEIPADLVEVIKEEDLPDKRKDRDLESIEKNAFLQALLPMAAGLLARPAMGAIMRGALGKGLSSRITGLIGQPAVKNIGQGIIQNQVGKGLNQGAGGAPGAAPAPAAGPVADPGAVRPPGFFSAINDSPGSQSHIPSDDTDDPEEADPHENNDGDKKPLQVENDVNGVGGTDSPFSEGVLNELLSNLPHVLDWASRPEPGKDDPILQKLHNLLEGDQPGYLDDADEDKAHHALVMIVQHGDKDQPQEPHNPAPKTALLQPGLDEPGNTTFNAQDVKQMMQPLQGRCPSCGSTIDPGSSSCPQCGAGNMNQLNQPLAAAPPDHSFMYEETDIPPDQTIDEWNKSGRPIYCDSCSSPTVDKTSRRCTNCGMTKQAGGQGPQTDEQKAAVAQFLIENQRQDEIPQMLVQPDQYADELAQVIGKDQPPQMSEQDQQAPAAPPAPMSPEQGMPSPDPSMAGQMMAAVNRYANGGWDLAPDTRDVRPEGPFNAQPPVGQQPCPTCSGPLDPTGQCPGCGHIGNPTPPPASGLAPVAKTADDHIKEHGDNFDNHVGVPGADVIEQENPEAEQDSSHTWKDADGNPLKPGQEYEMHSDQYDIPDIIRVEEVRPDSIHYTLTGEYGMHTSTDLDHEEAQLENIQFVPIQESHPDEVPGGDLGQNMDDIGRPAPGEQTDLSTPHQQFSSTREWLKEGGANFSPHEQRQFIEEAGVARNADKLDLSGTHYESSRIEVDEDYFLFGQ